MNIHYYFNNVIFKISEPNYILIKIYDYCDTIELLLHCIFE